VVDTPINAARRDEMKAWAESPALPARRFGQAEDIADGILFLMNNPYATGQMLTVDGGYSAT
jgi:NAD(P)-dependent dehydrogenase (short-subunit alcohol dehydrogenase family)